MKTIVQCDFDGTVTIEDVSFMLLDAFADNNWHAVLDRYQRGEITVGRFSTEVFGLIKADEKTLLDSIHDKVDIRAGFVDLVAACRRRGFRFVIVSNGLTFYIEHILKDIGINGIEVFAAETVFDPDGLKVKYVSPDGDVLNSDFKLAYVRHFRRQGYRVLYIGNGTSDAPPAEQSDYIFATDSLLTYCKRTPLSCTPFSDFRDVVKVLEGMS